MPFVTPKRHYIKVTKPSSSPNYDGGAKEEIRQCYYRAKKLGGGRGRWIGPTKHWTLTGEIAVCFPFPTVSQHCLFFFNHVHDRSQP